METVVDDAATIQAMIDKVVQDGQKEVVIRANPNDDHGVWHISQVIELPSQITVYIEDCTLRLIDGVFCNIFCNSLAYEKTLYAEEEQSDIHIIGRGRAVLDGGNHNGLVEKTSMTDGFPHIIYNTTVFFRNVCNFTVKGLHIINPRWWGMTFIYSRDGVISDLEFTALNNAPNQDGVDLRVGCNNIVIENITGRTGDDSVALTALSGRLERRMSVPDKNSHIHDITIRKIHTEVTGGHHIVRLLNHDGNRLYNIHISDIHDTTLESGGKRARAALKIGDARYIQVRKAAWGETDSIIVSDIKTRAQYAVLIGNPNVTGSEFKHIYNEEGILFGIDPA